MPFREKESHLIRAASSCPSVARGFKSLITVVIQIMFLLVDVKQWSMCIDFQSSAFLQGFVLTRPICPWFLKFLRFEFDIETDFKASTFLLLCTMNSRRYLYLCFKCLQTSKSKTKAKRELNRKKLKYLTVLTTYSLLKNPSLFVTSEPFII